MKPETRNPKQASTRIVILGGGFGGAYCAQTLQKTLRQTEADVLLIDRNDYFVFFPLLVEAGTGNLEPRHVIVPIRSFLGRRTRFRMGETLGVDPQKQIVRYRMVGGDEELEAPYDQLVIALGSVPAMPPVPGLKENAWHVKSLADAVALRDRAIQVLELANTMKDGPLRRSLLHFVVVGSNFTGVEIAGEFNEYLREAAKRYRNLSPRDCRVTVVERSGRILAALDEGLANYALKAMRKSGIDVILNTGVTEIREHSVILSDNRELDASTVVWCAGIAQNPSAAALPFEKDKRGFILCENDFRVKQFNNVWAIGDCAVNLDPQGKPYPATAQHATRMGIHVAKNVTAAIKSKPIEPFTFRTQGYMAALGCRTAVAQVFGIKVSGFAAWWFWRTAYLSKMPTLSRKFRVVVDWTMDLLFKRDYVQLGLHRKSGGGK